MQSIGWFGLVAIAAMIVVPVASRAADAKPIRALLLTGGCCHDYAHQKDILKKGIEARANVVVDIIWANKDGKNDGSTSPALPIYGNPDYAKGYDVIIHDECSADVKD